MEDRSAQYQIYPISYFIFLISYLIIQALSTNKNLTKQNQSPIKHQSYVTFRQ